MSRSQRASTESFALAQAVLRGAGKGARLVHRGRLEHPGLGIPRPSKRCLLRLAVAIVPLSCAPAAIASPGGNPRAHHAHAQIHRAAPRSTQRAGAHAAGARPARLVRELRHARGVVLSPGSGYGRVGGSPLVRALQIRMADAGYAPGPIDGLYGPRTDRSVSRFQGAHGLQVDGLAGPKTLAEAAQPAAALYPRAGYATGGAAPVRGLQSRLARAGYSPGPVDGLFGPRTERAVRRFQTAQGLPGDGIAGPRTIARLRRPQSLPRRPHHRTPGPKASSRRPAPAAPRPAARPGSHSPATGHRRTSRPTSGPAIGWELPAGILAAALLLVAGAWYGRRRRVGRSDGLPENRRHAAPAQVPGKNGPRPLVPGTVGPMAIEAEFQRAIGREEAVKAFNLAVLLEKQHDRAGARAAYERADRAGHAGAACNLGVMMEIDGELPPAQAAYARADQRGDANGAFNLGALLDEQGEADEARAAYARADQRGHAEAGTNLGVLLEIQGKIAEAREAYQRAERRGDPHAAANLGALLDELGDREGARAAHKRAKRLRQQPAPDTVRSMPQKSAPLPAPSPAQGGERA